MNNEKLNQEIIEIIHSNIIAIPREEIKGLYDKWLIGDGTEKTKWIQNKKLINEHQNTPSDASLCGIDLPFYFGDIEKTSKKRIMIIGLDPLRNEKSFENKADINEDVLLGTPYALHLKDKEKNKYWKIIKNLQNDNFIYLTDLHKVFFKTGKTGKNRTGKNRSYNYYRKNENNSKEILLKEIELIKPHVIVTFGGNVKEAIQKITELKIPSLFQEITKIKIDNSSEITVLPLAHPAARYDALKGFLNDNKASLLRTSSKSLEEKYKVDDYCFAFSELINYHLRND